MTKRQISQEVLLLVPTALAIALQQTQLLHPGLPYFFISNLRHYSSAAIGQDNAIAAGKIVGLNGCNSSGV